jgi:hypothetical protein
MIWQAIKAFRSFFDFRLAFTTAGAGIALISEVEVTESTRNAADTSDLHKKCICID